MMASVEIKTGTRTMMEYVLSPVMKAILRRCSRADAVRVIEEAMKLTTAEEIDRHLRGFEARLGIEVA